MNKSIIACAVYVICAIYAFTSFYSSTYTCIISNSYTHVYMRFFFINNVDTFICIVETFSNNILTYQHIYINIHLRNSQDNSLHSHYIRNKEILLANTSMPFILLIFYAFTVFLSEYFIYLSLTRLEFLPFLISSASVLHSTPDFLKQHILQGKALDW